MNKIFFVFLALFSVVVLADPKPFGLELGKASIKDLEAKFAVSYSGVNRYSDGKMFDIEVTDLPISGISKATAIFDDKGRLAGMLLTTSNRKFDSFYSSMRSKYRTVSKVIPFVGNKSVKFVEGGSFVMLEAPHMSFSMQVNYLTKGLNRAFNQSNNAKSKRKSDAMFNNL